MALAKDIGPRKAFSCVQDVHLAELVAFCYYNASGSLVRLGDQIVRQIYIQMHLPPKDWLDSETIVSGQKHHIDRSQFYEYYMSVLEQRVATPELFFRTTAPYVPRSTTFYKELVWPSASRLN